MYIKIKLSIYREDTAENGTLGYQIGYHFVLCKKCIEVGYHEKIVSLMSEVKVAIGIHIT